MTDDAPSSPIPMISIAKRSGLFNMQVLPPHEADPDNEHVVLKQEHEEGFVTILTVPRDKWEFLQTGDVVMVDIIITRLGTEGTMQ